MRDVESQHTLTDIGSRRAMMEAPEGLYHWGEWEHRKLFDIINAEEVEVLAVKVSRVTPRWGCLQLWVDCHLDVTIRRDGMLVVEQWVMPEWVGLD